MAQTWHQLPAKHAHSTAEILVEQNEENWVDTTVGKGEKGREEVCGVRDGLGFVVD